MASVRRVCGAPLRSEADPFGHFRFVQGSATHLFCMDTETPSTDNPWGLEPLLDVKELAAYLHVPVSTVYDWRTRGLAHARTDLASI